MVPTELALVRRRYLDSTAGNAADQFIYRDVVRVEVDSASLLLELRPLHCWIGCGHGGEITFDDAVRSQILAGS
jgi:hypothetical protein